jgi:hypothetical protein
MKKIRGKSFLYILASLILLFALVGGTWFTAAAATQVDAVIPTISILSVSPDVSVTIRTANYPANDTFKVYMNFFGTRGVDGVLVDTIDSGSGGSFDKTFTIPTEMKGLRQIAIRLESSASGYFSYNWFNNVSGGTIPDTGGPITPGLIPTISISSVSPDNTVTIQTYNYPANDTFKVLMGKFGTRGVGGIEVDSFDTGSGGSFSKTFTIPNELKGLRQIAIRLESSASGYFSYNWFNNVSGGTIPDTGGPVPLPGVIPTFTISSVAVDSTVTIKTSNFPANDTFKVLMGNFGTRGIGGVEVDTIDSGSGGTLTLTFNIPDSLKGKGTIAIRLESPSSGYFSYNWFYNTP